ncbi:nuA4-domain containing protein isoform X2 [Glycine max]|uniref:nuA4-domain containing protein isoform X2 n=1 Tax=Glycine max TaxID=3847 RepID=UPI00071936F8|nr:nuA4-domain containing protein isoform X2 [Glycine max]|eukprot:XP_014618000.1 nuA4-domain containing protein isoform X2 [Glycine max]
MESEGQKGTVNPSAMLASLLSRRAKLHEELRSIEKQVDFSTLASGCPSKGAETFSHYVYDMETSYLQDPGQCGNVLKGFEGFLSSSKNTALRKSLQLDEMMVDQIMVLVVQKVEEFMLMDRVNQRKVEVGQEKQREQGLQVNKILIMKMILT